MNQPVTTSRESVKHSRRKANRTAALTLASLGVVYGDIGTSPLYAVRECFHGAGRLTVTPDNVFGVLSLVLWSLLLVVSLKYLMFVMRADNDGEGGILALMTLAVPRDKPSRRARLLTLLGLFGAGLLYGDGAITPAISVLSAVEGLHIATPAFDRFVLPVSVAILLTLFLVQRRGTALVGRMFGPVMIVWFTVIAVLGAMAIAKNSTVLFAASPHYAIHFLAVHRGAGITILGIVFLVVTGGEALYADLGHFGVRPIRLAWFTVVLPALVTNYFGQGALLLSHPGASRNPFYLLAPSWALYPLVILATAATVIASQAIISGAFSLSGQAIRRGFSPRMSIIHTSKDEQGQIYVPVVNWLLFVAVIGLTVAFRSSDKLAAAYGMAVTTTMVITSLLFYFVARQRWQWSVGIAGPLVCLFLLVDVAFLFANIPKIPEGGWFPLVVGAGACGIMTTWQWGQQSVTARLAEHRVSLESLRRDLESDGLHRVDTPAIYLAADRGSVPLALLHNLNHNFVVHQPLGLLTIVIEDRPWVSLDERLEFQALGSGVDRIVAHYGFKQPPNVANIADLCRQYDVDFTRSETTFFLGRITLDVVGRPSLRKLRKQLFQWLYRNSTDVSAYFNIPPDQVVEIGQRLEL